MRKILAPSVAITAVTLSAYAASETVEMPSGLSGYLFEVLADEPAELYRFRFVADAFSNSAELAVIGADLVYLCTKVAVPTVPDGAQVIVSLADQPSEFGVASPDVTQVFEAFRVQDARCMWEEF